MEVKTHCKPLAEVDQHNRTLRHPASQIKTASHHVFSPASTIELVVNGHGEESRGFLGDSGLDAHVICDQFDPVVSCGMENASAQ